MRVLPQSGAAVLLVLLGTASADGDDAVPAALTGPEVARRWHSRMAGRHFVAHVRMSVDLGGMTEERRITVHRDDQGGSAERVLIRFESPPSLRKMGLLYLEQRDRPNDYFLYRPAVRRVRRLTERAVTSNLYGIDPEFLGFGLAETEPTHVESLAIVELDGRRVYRLVESAQRSNERFEERTVWIDPVTFIPLRTEHRLRGKVVLSAETLEIRTLGGVPTPVRMRFERPTEHRGVELEVESVDYALPIPEHVFTVFAMTKTDPDAARSQD